MASRGKDSVGTAADHGRDLYSWLVEQARLVRDGRWDAVDQANLAREIEALAQAEFSKLENAMHVLLTLLLKWDHSAIRRSRGRAQSVQAQRQAVIDVLARNPGLKARVAEVIAHCYRKARTEAASDVGLDEDSFPAKCPYEWDEIVAREFAA
jgi:Domain of unknown function DUF29